VSTQEGFEDLAGSLDYPMFLVTTAAGPERAGCLVGFATQTSIQPIRFLVCLSRANRTTQVAARALWLAVHVLREGDEDFARRFGEHSAADGIDKFAGVEWEPGPSQVPVLAGLDCVVGRITQRIPSFGDHIGHLVAVDDRSVIRDPARSARAPLGYQRVQGLDAGRPADAGGNPSSDAPQLDR
jgi:flavin reductase (DIM6/NTAB) family NADH-FMN oxidoreductase RutF